MRKRQLFKKRILALVLSASMIFASTDTYVALAAEAENPETEYLGLVETDSQADEEETDSVVLVEDSDSVGDSNSVGVPDVSEDIDSISQLDKKEETSATDGIDSDSRSNEDEETGIAGDSNATEESDVNETSEDKAEALAVENEDDVIRSGKINNIEWSISEDGLLTIEGTGDYIGYIDGDTPPWANREDVLSAEVNLSGIKSTKNMFAGCSKLVEIVFTAIDTSNVTDMSRMFYGCSSLANLDLTEFNTENVTEINDMFFDCDVLYTLDLSSFDMSKVITDEGPAAGGISMFNGCRILSYLKTPKNVNIMVPLPDGWPFNWYDESEHDESDYYETLPTGLDYSITLIKFGYMWPENPPELEYSGVINDITWSIDEDGLLTIEGTGDYMDYNEGYAPPWANREDVLFAKVKVSDIKSTKQMFTSCFNLEEIDFTETDTSNVTDMSYMFFGCSSLISLNLSDLDTSSVTNMKGMFSYCDMTSLNLSGLDTSSVTDMREMFFGCSNLTDLNLSGLDTSSVTSMGGMFSGCSSMDSLDLSIFDMTNVADAAGMFDNCSSLSYIRTPKNCYASVQLPLNSDDDKWYQAIDDPCEEFPVGLENSIELYKNGYPEDGKTKRKVFISGITINSKIYDAKLIEYDDADALVQDADGNEISDISINYSYMGTLSDGSDYDAETEQAPSQAGRYTLICRAENDQYEGQTLYSFYIRQKELTITAPSLEIETGDDLPELEGLECTVEGLINDEELIIDPLLRYSMDDISTDEEGSYEIIPYGADAGNNYKTTYVNGTLTISEGEGDDNQGGNTGGSNPSYPPGTVFPPSGGNSGLNQPNTNPGGTDNPYYDKNSKDDSKFTREERANNDLSDETKTTISDIKAVTYDGTYHEPAIKVTFIDESGKKTILTEGADYRILYEDNRDAGTEAKVTIKGNGIYSGEQTKEFTINPKQVKKLKIVAGSLIAGDNMSNPPIYVYDGDTLLKKDVDYELPDITSVTASPSAKPAAITVAARDGGNYTGSATVNVSVYDDEEASSIIDESSIVLDGENDGKTLEVAYTGRAIKPTPITVKTLAGNVLEKSNYKVTYKNNKNVGTATVIITGRGGCKGKAVKTFNIVGSKCKDPENALRIKDIKERTYNGKLQKPSITVIGNDGRKLKKNRDYTVYYKDNLHVGKATVVVVGKGNYAGKSGTNEFVIKPQKLSKVSVKGTSTDLRIVYNKSELKWVEKGNEKSGETYDCIVELRPADKNRVWVKIKATENSDFITTGSVNKKIKQ